MTSEEIFLAAVEKATPAERAAYIERACGGDKALRAEVERLLMSHEQAGSFLGQPLFEPTPTVDQPLLGERPGMQIGPYKLLQKLGEGGMGTVYMAEQKTPVERRVALKIIKPGMDTRAVIARFEAERQALALMDHPNIAKVLDAGTTDAGRPYFVMELVKGIPITQYSDEHQLTPRQRLELFLPVCHAVQHAHHKGIIHRDIKPSNVLVAEYDQDAVPKIIDFGVAKAIGQRLTEKTMFTEFGQVVGTIEYMSPEQAKLNQLDIDTRTDIYSLGVLLYELLTGETPLDRLKLRSAAFDEMLRIIREEEPPKPSTRLSTADMLPSIAANRHTEPKKLTMLIRGELDWIVMKALEKDRNRRYETANGLGMDIQRYLNDEHVLACPPSAAYRLRKFARRNKAALTTASVVAAALVVGITISTWQAVRATKAEGLAQTRLTAEQHARHEAELARDGEARQRLLADEQRDLAEKNAAEAEAQRVSAEANFAKARQAVDEYLTQVTESELLTVPGLQPLREDLLEAALKFYTEFTQERAGDRSLKRELAAAQHRLSLIQRELGNTEAFKMGNAEAIRMFEVLRAQDPTTLDAQVGLVRAYFVASRHDDAAKLSQEILQSDPQHAEVRSLLAETYNSRAVAAGKTNKLDAALKFHQQAFVLREALVREFPEKADYLAQLGATVNNLGTLLSRQGKLPEALAMFERGAEYSAQAYQRAPHSILWGQWLCNGLGNVASKQAELGQQEEALRWYQQLVTVARKRAFDNPAIMSPRADLSKAYLNLARFQRRIGNTAEANRLFRDAREVLENIPRETPDQLFELATVYTALIPAADTSANPTDADAAELTRNADLAVQALQKAVAVGYANAAALKTSRLLDPLRERDDFQELVATVEKAAEAQRLASNSGGTADQKLANRQQAVTLLNDLVTRQPTEVRHRSTLAATLQSIGEIQIGLKQFVDAEKSLHEALALRLQLAQDDAKNTQRQVDVLATRIALGFMNWESGRRGQAHRTWQECLSQLHKLARAFAKDLPLQVSISVQEGRISDAYGGLGLWDLAAARVRHNAELKRITHPVSDARHSLLLPGVANEDELRSYCRLLDDWFKRNGTSASSANLTLHLAWCAGMVDPPGLPPAQLLEWAKRSHDADPKNHWHIFCLALAQHRAGQHASAMATLEMHPTNKDWSSFSGGGIAKLSHAYLYALAARRGDQIEHAQTQLQHAEKLYRELCEGELQGGPMGIDQSYWWEFAAAQILRREAWRVIAGKTIADPLHHMIQAWGYQQLGENERAVAEWALADAEMPNEPELWIFRARLAERSTARDRSAETAWQRAVEVAGNDPLPWIQRGHWYAERGDHQKADADFAKAASLTPNELNKFLEAGWWVVGPYPKELKEFCPPEVDPDPSQPVHVIDPKTGLSDEPVRWQRVSSAESAVGAQDGTVDLTSLPARKGNGSVYALGYLFSPDERSVTLFMRKDQPSRVWVNGAPTEAPSADAIGWLSWWRVPIVLRQGRNTILIKTASQRFMALLSDAPAARAWELFKFGDVDRAVEAYAQALQISTHEWIVRHACFAALVTGNQEDYREFSKRLPSHSNPDGDKGILDAEVYGSTAVAEADLPRLKRIVEHWYASPQRKREPWFERMLAWSHYRLGEFDKVVSVLGDLRDEHASPALAMAYYRLGQQSLARQWLSRAEAVVDRRLKDFTGNGQEGLWLIYPTYREAVELIRGNSTDLDARFEKFLQERHRLWDARDPLTCAFDDAICNAPNDPHPYIARGKRLAALGRFAEAEADFNRAVELKPDDPDVLAARAVFFADTGHPDKAAADFHAALNLFTDEQKPAWRWAQPIMQQAVRQKDVFERLVALRPADNQLLLHRTIHCFFSGELADAQTAAKEGLVRSTAALLAGDRETYETHRTTSTDGWDPYFAVLHLAQAPTREPMTTRLLALAETMWGQAEKSPQRRRLLGLAQLRAGKLNEAVGSLEASLTPAEWHEDAMLWPLLAIATSQLGLHDQARTWLNRSERWIELTHGVSDSSRLFGPYDAIGVNFLLAHVFYFEAKALIDGPDAATQAREQLAARGREGRRTIEARADALRKDALAKSEAAWNRAVELAGNDPAPWIERGRFYAAHGQPEKADADFAQAFKLDPNHPLCRLQRAKQNRTVLAEWDFSRGASGWRGLQNCNLTAADGALLVESTSSDPYFGNTDVKAPAGRQELTFCARFQGAITCELYWATKSATYSESQKVTLQMADSAGKWQEYRVQFEPNGELVGLRFDPPQEGNSRIELAWMMLAGFSTEADFQRAIELADTDPIPLIHRGRWYAQRGEQEKADADFTKALSLTPNELNKFFEAGWWVVGPYPANLKEFCPPEVDPDPAKPVPTVHPQQGFSDDPVGWTTVATKALWQIDPRLRTMFPQDSSVYALAYVYAPEERTSLMRVANAKALRIWINGQLAFESEEPLNSVRIPITLRQGRNQLLVKTPANTDLALRLGDTPLDRALTFAERRLWRESTELFRGEALPFVQQTPSVWSDLSKFALLVGEEQLYRDQCVQLLERARSTTNNTVKYVAAHTASFAPNPVLQDRHDELIRMALSVANRGTDASSQGQTGRALATAAWASLQAGRLPEAEKYLAEIPPIVWVEELVFSSRAVLAARQGNHDAATRWLEKSYEKAARCCEASGPRYLANAGALLLAHREAEREVTGNTTRIDVLLKKTREMDLVSFNSADPLIAAFDHRIQTHGAGAAEATATASWFLARGRRLVELGRSDAAEFDFDKAVELEPSAVEPLVARARFHVQRGELTRARTNFEAALKLARAEKSSIPLAAVEREIGLHDAVLVEWQKQLPENAMLWRIRAERQLALGNWKEAAELFSQGNPHWYHEEFRAALCCLLDDAAGYERACQRHLELSETIADSSDRNHRRLYARALRPVAAEQAAEFERLLDEALKFPPSEKGLNFRTAIALYRQGRHNEALAMLDDVFAGGDWQYRAKAWPLRALIHWKLGHHQEAQKWLARTAWWIDLTSRTAERPHSFATPNPPPFVWLTTQVLYREARELIELGRNAGLSK